MLKVSGTRPNWSIEYTHLFTLIALALVTVQTNVDGDKPTLSQLGQRGGGTSNIKVRQTLPSDLLLPWRS